MNRFRYFVTVCMVMLGFFAQAQDDLEYPLAVEEAGLMTYMANLAWLNNPANDNYFQEEVIAKEKIKIAKRGWWRDIGLRVNANELSFAPDSIENNAGVMIVNPKAAGNLFHPKYNFSAVFNLGAIFDTPNKKKIAQRKLIIAESMTQQAKKDIRGKIIQMYQEYLTTIEILKLRYKSESDMKASYDLINQLFESGDKRVGLKDVLESSLALNNAAESRIKANKMMIIAKMKLEDFIGVKLEAVEAKFKGR